VLDIAVPAARGSELLRAIGDEWPAYLAYLVSCFTIGALWIAHSAITECLERVDLIFLRLNLVLLLLVGFLPLPTRLAAEYINSSSGERVAVTIYGICLLLSRLMVFAVWHYGVREHLVRPDLSDDDVAAITGKLTPSVGAYVVAIGLGLLVPTVAVVLYLFVALYLVIPFGALRRLARPER
jgi:uncharacterized membrane protein